MATVHAKLVQLGCPFIPTDLDELNLEAYVSNLLAQSNESRQRIILWLLAQIELTLTPNDSNILRSTFELVSNAVQAEPNEQTRLSVENKLKEAANVCVQLGLVVNFETAFSILNGTSKSFETNKRFITTLADVLTMEKDNDSVAMSRGKFERSCDLLDNLAAMRLPNRMVNALNSKFYERALLARMSKPVRDAVEKRATLLESGLSNDICSGKPGVQKPRAIATLTKQLDTTVRIFLAALLRNQPLETPECPQAAKVDEELKEVLQQLETMSLEVRDKALSIRAYLESKAMQDAFEAMDSSMRLQCGRVDEKAERLAEETKRANALFDNWLQLALTVESIRAEFASVAKATDGQRLCQIDRELQTLRNVANSFVTRREFSSNAV